LALRFFVSRSHETSPPTISASGGRHCRAGDGLAHREGANVSVAAGTLDRWLSRWRRGRHNGPPDRSVAVGAAWPEFVIENRPGAGTNIATEAVVRAPADGYTVLLATSANAINATLYERLNFDFIRDTAPVASIVDSPLVMEVSPSFPAKTISEFIAYAKSNPGKLSMASGGVGSPNRSLANC
jgi:hypothetical protein